MDEREQAIADGLAAVRGRIDAACLAAGRQDMVGLVVVTKTFPASDVQILDRLRLIDGLGIVGVGENRDQEARAKRVDVGESGLRWHMIGQVQRNKAASVARWADVVESVDRVELAAAVGRAAREAGRTIDVLVQVSVDPDPRVGRGGVDPRDALVLASAVAGEQGLRLRGVMGVAPIPDDPASATASTAAFQRLAAVSERVRTAFPGADIISAGMSGDLEQAIAHGATQVRVGGAILGQRSVVQ